MKRSAILLLLLLSAVVVGSCGGSDTARDVSLQGSTTIQQTTSSTAVSATTAVSPTTQVNQPALMNLITPSDLSIRAMENWFLVGFGKWRGSSAWSVADEESQIRVCGVQSPWGSMTPAQRAKLNFQEVGTPTPSSLNLQVYLFDDEDISLRYFSDWTESLHSCGAAPWILSEGIEGQTRYYDDWVYTRGSRPIHLRSDQGAEMMMLNGGQINRSILAIHELTPATGSSMIESIAIVDLYVLSGRYVIRTGSVSINGKIRNGLMLSAVAAAAAWPLDKI